MSALHEAVARAIANALDEWGELVSDDHVLDEAATVAAAAAIRVVLAEATRSIEALRGYPVVLEERAGPVQYYMVRTDEVLDVLAALGDEA